MTNAAARSPALSGPITKPISIGGLAAHIGVPRQRIYTLVQRGLIKAAPLSGGLVIAAPEAQRVVDSAIRVDTNTGRSRIVFDFV